MIQRFNFYDIYGYFIPGLAVVVLLWLPYAVVSQRWPDAQLVVAALGLAYVIGHILQSIAANSFSSKLDQDERGNAVYPSSAMLDAADERLSPDLKQRVQVNVQSWFGIDLAIDATVDDAARKLILKSRQGAFFLCRPIANARSPYAEQFEGLYVMTRGLAVAFGLSAAYMTGWLLVSVKASATTAIVEGLVALCVVASFVASLLRASRPFGTNKRERIDQRLMAALAVLFLSTGYLLAAMGTLAVANSTLLVFAACIPGYLAIALRFIVLYRYFADEFAKAVWTSFAVEPTERPTKT